MAKWWNKRAKNEYKKRLHEYLNEDLTVKGDDVSYRPHIQPHQCVRLEELRIDIDPKVWAKIHELYRSLPNLEWLALLEGQREGMSIHITDIFVPKQEVTSTFVEVDETDEEYILFTATHPVVAVIHSHNDMSAFHSSTDDAYLFAADLSLVIGRDGVKGFMLTELPCGHKVVVEIPSDRIQMRLPDVSDWVREVRENISRRVVKYIPAGGGKGVDIIAATRESLSLVDDDSELDKYLTRTDF